MVLDFQKINSENTRQAEWLSEVQQENVELRNLLDEMQGALDLIMIKHRNQVLNLPLKNLIEKKVASLVSQHQRTPIDRDEAYLREKTRADFFEQVYSFPKLLSDFERKW